MNSQSESQPSVLAEKPVQIAGQLHIDRGLRGSLVIQIVDQISSLIARGSLLPLERMPSVRGLALALSVSSFSVVEAYDRLVAAGLLISRRGSGYFVAPRRLSAGNASDTTSSVDEQSSMNIAALLEPELFSALTDDVSLLSGTPYLPADWSDPKWIKECLRVATRSRISLQTGFSHPFGLLDLRRQLARCLTPMGIDIGPDHVLLTHSAGQSIDLSLRALTRPGDAVLVEDPSFAGLLALVEQHNLKPLLVSRSAAGLDLDQLTQLAQAHRPKLAIITTVLHNPLGVSLNVSQAHQLLSLAEKFDFRLIEDDVFRRYADPGDPSLAAMDGFRRVIRIDGTSKVLPSVARIGSLMASPDILSDIARCKVRASLHGSPFNEKLALHILSSSEFKRHISRVKARLDVDRESMLDMLSALNMAPLAAPKGGPFVCARLDMKRYSGTDVARFALQHQIVLSPCLRFTRSQGDAPWFRFNVAGGANPRLYAMFRALLRGQIPETCHQ